MKKKNKKTAKGGGKAGGKGTKGGRASSSGCAAKTPEGKGICFRFNNESETCKGKCLFEHVCGRCFGKHPMYKCPGQTAAAASSSQQQMQ